MWGIEKRYELAEPTLGSFLWMRVAMILEFVILHVPLILLIVKVMEWTGDYLVLAFLLATAVVKIVILKLYPMLIMPLFSSFEELPSWAMDTAFGETIKRLAGEAGILKDQIYLERSFEYDVHVNASTAMGQIALGMPVFRHHGH